MMSAPPPVTWLFVPGDRPERFDKAAAAGADEVILDVEDAVGADAKAEAREHAARWLAGDGSAWVRVNGVDTEWWAEDLAALAGSPGLSGVVVPKADRAAVTRVREHTEAPLLALVESATGVLEAPEVAAADGVVRLAFGSIDYAVDIAVEESWESLLLARSTLVLASRAAGLPGPVDGVTTAVRDTERATADALAGRRLGFAGKLCIHPAQVAAVEAAYAPSAAEVTWAQRLADALGGSERLLDPGADLGTAVQVDGAMVDRPVLLRARDVLRRATHH